MLHGEKPPTTLLSWKFQVNTLDARQVMVMCLLNFHRIFTLELAEIVNQICKLYYRSVWTKIEEQNLLLR